ncbi:hypothetical protein [Streptomyces viridochromogenes]|nr:hypothetical protein [Streptomyces viridochromogenes]
MVNNDITPCLKQFAQFNRNILKDRPLKSGALDARQERPRR